MELTAVIIDDEANSRSVLRKLLKMFCPHVLIKGEADNVEDAYTLIMATIPSIVFLDIQMPGANGFSLLKKFSDIPFRVIFVTSYDKYALEAIKFSAFDYLLKPVDVEELVLSVNRLQQNAFTKEVRIEQIINVIAHVDGESLEKKIVVHHNNYVKFLLLNEILYMESDRNYTIINTVKEERYISSKNLGEYEETLENHQNFFRINKSYLININHMAHYTKKEPCILTLSNNMDFEISRRKKHELLERISKRI